jgi:hypothetical protein
MRNNFKGNKSLIIPKDGIYVINEHGIYMVLYGYRNFSCITHHIVHT